MPRFENSALGAQRFLHLFRSMHRANQSIHVANQSIHVVESSTGCGGGGEGSSTCSPGAR